MARGFLIAAPHSGSGKTTVTLGLLRALKQQGIAVKSFKAGPDFIDPQFHRAASGSQCINLDPWAMRTDYLQQMFYTVNGVAIVEAMMGLFDGAADGSGSAADLAALFDLPVVLVVDAAKQSHSIAALVSGYQKFRNDISIAGVILNKVGSARHVMMLQEALDAVHVPVLGAVTRDQELSLPSRHLGLVQADEHVELEDFLDHAALAMEKSLDFEALLALSYTYKKTGLPAGLQPMGQKIAIACDKAFAFSYPHLLKSWRDQGAELSFFSPIENEAPQLGCDSIFLPGGYPELHAGKLATSLDFITGLKNAARRGAFVYGECGGYMALGNGLINADGKRHQMAGLLPLVTSFEKRQLHLGYRNARVLSDLPFANKGSTLACHEFHYSTLLEEGAADRLFNAIDARGEDIGTCGLRVGNVAGSYMHVIDHR